MLQQLFQNMFQCGIDEDQIRFEEELEQQQAEIAHEEDQFGQLLWNTNDNDNVKATTAVPSLRQGGSNVTHNITLNSILSHSVKEEEEEEEEEEATMPSSQPTFHMKPSTTPPTTAEKNSNNSNNSNNKQQQQQKQKQPESSFWLLDPFCGCGKSVPMVFDEEEEQEEQEAVGVGVAMQEGNHVGVSEQDYENHNNNNDNNNKTPPRPPQTEVFTNRIMPPQSGFAPKLQFEKDGSYRFVIRLSPPPSPASQNNHGDKPSTSFPTTTTTTTTSSSSSSSSLQQPVLQHNQQQQELPQEHQESSHASLLRQTQNFRRTQSDTIHHVSTESLLSLASVVKQHFKDSDNQSDSGIPRHYHHHHHHHHHHHNHTKASTMPTMRLTTATSSRE